MAHESHLNFLLRLFRAVWGTQAPSLGYATRPDLNGTQRRLNQVFGAWDTKLARLRAMEYAPDCLDAGTGHPAQ